MLIGNRHISYLLAIALTLSSSCSAPMKPGFSNPRIVPVATGWAKNSVNATIFRVNSLTTHAGIQYIAFYDENANVMLAKRKLDTTNWQIHKTRYKGNTKDAHNGISIAVDASGILHMSWDHHCDPLNYCRSVAPARSN